MEKINLHNYQAYLLDLVEGNLDEPGRHELFAFLELHPELKQELDDFEALELNNAAGSQEYPGKEALKKNSTSDELLIGYIENTLTIAERAYVEKQLETSAALREQLHLFSLTLFSPELQVIFNEKDQLKKQPVTEEQLIAYTENLLSVEEKNAIQVQMSFVPALKAELELYKQAIAVPDTEITFPGKEGLKRETQIVALPQYNYRYAAIAASLLLVAGLIIFFLPAAAEKAKSFAFAGEIKMLKYILEPVSPGDEKHKKANDYPGKNKNNKNFSNGIAFQNDSLKKKDNLLITFSPLIDSLPVKNRIPVDNNIPVNKDAFVINKSSVDENNDEMLNGERLNTRQYIAQRIQETAWGEEENKKPAKKKLSAFDVIAAVAKKLKNLGSKKTDAKIEYNEETETREYTLTLGKLSVTRSKPIRE